MSDLAGMTALVTGGGSGIGLGAAKRLAADGAHVTIAGRTEARLAEAVAEITAVAAPGVDGAVRRVRRHREADVARAVAAAIEPTGGLDVLFACAGGSLHCGPIVDVRRRRAGSATVDLNLVGHVPRASSTRRRRWRAAAAVRSSACRRSPGDTTHVHERVLRGKAGIEMLVKVAADELGEHGIRVERGAARPRRHRARSAFITAGGKLLDDYLEQMPVARVGTVDDIAAGRRASSPDRSRRGSPAR